ncbi:TraX family protein [Anaerocolumna aminovalerica]|jgi:hypothetical protein|uniref:TraX protein n=1 Tax=Anaerocolumna aminovalerica TaxID=1527 RepID=A0A1I5E1P4_9FIRM|nr:TraX family protein [Anaerocolumna aminovalerica]MBU5331097.1 conjugal transfer protein TraX [Anaerocolumna aminovalerica]MDU6263492.1 TraX family protein [Anaerocolumna aminovalerica]SFO05190.1 TraX protein [Anaerocolumna aminovalerica]
MSTTTLKIIAAIFMLVDHIGNFIPKTPIFFRWIGRISAPLFFFCMAWGLFYTKNRKIYLLRMYLFGVSMSIMNDLINNIAIKYHFLLIKNNIFITILISCLIISIIDIFHVNPIKGKKYILIFTILQLFGTILIAIIDFLELNLPFYISNDLIGAILCNVFLTEGGISGVLLGVLLYYTKQNKKTLTISFSIYCLLYSFLFCTNTVAQTLLKLKSLLPIKIYTILYAIATLFKIPTIPIYGIHFYQLTSYHWMQIFALPFMLSFNMKKGKGYKYFFYLFYPIHIYILYFIGNIIR